MVCVHKLHAILEGNDDLILYFLGSLPDQCCTAGIVGDAHVVWPSRGGHHGRGVEVSDTISIDTSDASFSDEEDPSPPAAPLRGRRSVTQ